MITYHKIQTVYLRDPNTNFKKLLAGVYAKPEFVYLANNLWLWTEKVDGTNIRVKYNGETVEFAGKTDNATLHPELFKQLQSIFTVEKMAEIFPDAKDVCLYGEGFGAGIQTGGYYQQQKDFILFDAFIGGLWLERGNLENIAASLDCRIVPIVGSGTLSEAVEFAQTAYHSTIAVEPHVAEGLIMKPLVELQNRRGERVVTKIKFNDF